MFLCPCEREGCRATSWKVQGSRSCPPPKRQEAQDSREEEEDKDNKLSEQMECDAGPYTSMTALVALRCPSTLSLEISNQKLAGAIGVAPSFVCWSLSLRQTQRQRPSSVDSSCSQSSQANEIQASNEYAPNIQCKTTCNSTSLFSSKSAITEKWSTIKKKAFGAPGWGRQPFRRFFSESISKSMRCPRSSSCDFIAAGVVTV